MVSKVSAGLKLAGRTIPGCYIYYVICHRYMYKTSMDIARRRRRRRRDRDLWRRRPRPLHYGTDHTSERLHARLS